MKVFKSEDVSLFDDTRRECVTRNRDTLVIADVPMGSVLLKPSDRQDYVFEGQCVIVDNIRLKRSIEICECAWHNEMRLGTVYDIIQLASPAPSPDDEFEREWEKYRNLPPGPPRTMTKDTAKYFWDKAREGGK